MFFFSLLATNLSCVLGLRTFDSLTRFMNMFGPDHSHHCCQATTFFSRPGLLHKPCNSKKQTNIKSHSHSLATLTSFQSKRLPGSWSPLGHSGSLKLQDQKINEMKRGARLQLWNTGNTIPEKTLFESSSDLFCTYSPSHFIASINSTGASKTQNGSC